MSDRRIATTLIDEFGSLPLLLAAQPARQLRAAGDPQVVALLQAVKQTVRHVTRADLDERPVLPTSRALRDYLMAHLADEPNEHVRVLYLNGYDRLIVDELHSSGTPTSTPFCVRTIAARALEVGAMNVIVAHNHPSGLRQSSDADIAYTVALEHALDALGITLIDHLIVTRGGLASVRAASRAMAA
ncbi:MAG: DNA repair protein RadC [Sphingomonas sp.]|uniref:JAB domain-containing protein n=1 Tax=Sphingomonas sp. TaxID=28214 RepID=UPI001207415B|nr:JAB domain-containing protein [Sphingomonas sp.]THD34803.1 MAG: DNA repair protein RadC [Sphingomonas sp.]